MIMNIHKNEKGFSYLDVLVGLMILMVGVLALCAAVTSAVVRSRESEQQLIAKQLASSALESIFSARDIRFDDTDGWDAVGNLGSNPVAGTPRGVFLTGLRPIRVLAGKDGVVGTVDDACDAGGPCVVGGVSNLSAVIQGFRRQITITDIEDPERPSPPNGIWPIAFRRIDITISYNAGRAIREEKVSSIITKY
jgi:hypothetical protein